MDIHQRFRSIVYEVEEDKSLDAQDNSYDVEDWFDDI